MLWLLSNWLRPFFVLQGLLQAVSSALSRSRVFARDVDIFRELDEVMPVHRNSPHKVRDFGKFHGIAMSLTTKGVAFGKGTKQRSGDQK